MTFVLAYLKLSAWSLLALGVLLTYDDIRELCV